MINEMLGRISITWTDLKRAFVLSLPVNGLSVADEAYKLHVAGSNSNVDVPFMHLVALLSVAVTLWWLVRVKLPRVSGVLACIFTALVSYGIVAVMFYLRQRAIQGLIFADAQPLWVVATNELINLAGLWGGQALAATVILLIACLYCVQDRRHSSRLYGAMAAGILVLASLVVGVDFGFFAATGGQLSRGDLIYMLAAPKDVLQGVNGAAVFRAIVLVAVILIGITASMKLSKRLAGAATTTHRSVRLVPVVIVAALIGLAAQAASPDPALAPYGHSPFLILSGGESLPFTRHVYPEMLPGAASLRVPQVITDMVRPPVSSEHRWNVVIVMLESTRADSTTIYNPNLPTTPFEAQLARQSLVVDDMNAVIPRTSAAWVAILAGRYPGSLQVSENFTVRGTARIPSSLPNLLRPLGYRSAFVRSADLTLENEGALLHALNFDRVWSMDDLRDPGAELIDTGGYSKEDSAMLPAIRGWLDDPKESGRPFLLTVMTIMGHWPYGLPHSHPSRSWTSRGGQYNAYLSGINYVDGFLSRIVGLLKERGLLDNTVLVVMGDHGEEFQEHGGAIHGLHLFQESLHVPMLIRFPGAARKGHVGGLRQEIDVVPTIEDILGLSPWDVRLPGRSLLNGNGHDVLFYKTHPDGLYLAMRDGIYKYIYAPGSTGISVYDLSKDPLEQHDLGSSMPALQINQAVKDMQTWDQRVRLSWRPVD